jgi:hypothetical protein
MFDLEFHYTEVREIARQLLNSQVPLHQVDAYNQLYKLCAALACTMEDLAKVKTIVCRCVCAKKHDCVTCKEESVDAQAESAATPTTPIIAT